MQIKGKTGKWGIQRGGEALQNLFLGIRVYWGFLSFTGFSKPY